MSSGASVVSSGAVVASSGVAIVSWGAVVSSATSDRVTSYVAPFFVEGSYLERSNLKVTSFTSPIKFRVKLSPSKAASPLKASLSVPSSLEAPQLTSQEPLAANLYSYSPASTLLSVNVQEKKGSFNKEKVSFVPSVHQLMNNKVLSQYYVVSIMQDLNLNICYFGLL